MNMATVQCTAFLAIILVLHSHVATPTFSIPVISPFFGDACEETVCGRGTCLPSNNSTFGFECECEPGWQQARLEDDDYLKFLPCVIPNCTLNYTCANAPPARNNQQRPNLSFFDRNSVFSHIFLFYQFILHPCLFIYLFIDVLLACYWTDCGGGRCNRTSTFTHTCECEVGFYNLLNATVFPCYRQCAFGEDCPSLGFNTSTSILDPNPFFPDNYNSHAASLIPTAEFAGLISMVTTFARVVWM
ncbi:hypothetical protein Pfo_031265 [Paulownia fortunei]|nr:hypothetical protein Pfo_031265 [Paulownia fortunei]